MTKQTPDVAFSAARYSATSAVPQTPQLVRDGSADKNPRATLQKVVISIGRRGNLRGVDEEKVRTNLEHRNGTARSRWIKLLARDSRPVRRFSGR